MADADRGQQCYAIGSTGTGKSELLCNLAVQDITEGRGVAVLDPHGDLYWEVLKRVPSERTGDVVLIDFTDFDHVPGLNLLEVKTDRQELGRNFIIQDLTAIFRRLYGNVPESMGPMFFLYMRNAVSLVMEDPSGQSTLLDVPHASGGRGGFCGRSDRCRAARDGIGGGQGNGGRARRGRHLSAHRWSV